MNYVTITKFDVAKQQLFQAIEIYCEGANLVSAITLAGAAEEILGKLVDSANKTNALQEKLTQLSEIHEIIYKEPANTKEFANISNQAKNELKHIGNGESVEFNFEEEATALIDRAIDNYKKLVPRMEREFLTFNDEKLRRWREINENYA